ncbi:MAG: hypothetical protein KBG20_01195 [Caldilineaceae bacterium]|nr:hypothetical protein [Caldilineaceae bacterium]MBP8106602.1 hypothetical protein [Caldilineaceae bacterium]MBP8121309.1 hypothetical protein [Caldilineaceae bacterium]MBP9070875.1 hypothetical protein [Caldilineaceae bacterium]
MDQHTLEARIRDRIEDDWLTPSQLQAWQFLQRFDGTPNRVVNIYGTEGSGKSFLAWFLERKGHAIHSDWDRRTPPTLPRMVLDNAPTDRSSARSIRPLVDALGLQQIILISRRRVDEAAMPAFELEVTNDDIEHFAANLYRHFGIVMPEIIYPNFKLILSEL